MKFEEWKKGFSEKTESAIKAFEDMHEFLKEADEEDENFDGDEFLAFVQVKSMKIMKAIEAMS